MTKTNRILLVAICALPSVALAHTTGESGVPKLYCEDAADRAVHDYGPPGTNLTIFASTDGSLGPCGLAAHDGHQEFALGGAYLLAGAPAQDCWGRPADHPAYPTITVTDLALGPVSFSVWVDSLPVPCGDFETDVGVSCRGSCPVSLAPGADGAYYVYVEGTMGHVST